MAEVAVQANKMPTPPPPGVAKRGEKSLVMREDKGKCHLTTLTVSRALIKQTIYLY